MSSKLFRILSVFLIVGLLVVPVSVLADFDPDIIQGLVFNDTNQNGILDVGEEGIVNVPIGLLFNQEVIVSILTDSTGYFEFTVSDAGSYTVVETDLLEYLSTTPNEVDIVVDGTTILPTIHFGDVPVDDLAEISGFVYDDVNRNRIFDSDELGLPDVKITLEDSEGLLLENVVTDEYGSYSFQGLFVGMYSVIEEDPEGYYSTTPNKITLNLLMGEVKLDVNFGDFIPDPSEMNRIDPLISDFFDIPLQDIFDLRLIQKMGYGNIAKVFFASMLSGEPISTILDLLEEEAGWGNIWKEVVGYGGLKGYNLGLIVSGGDIPTQVENLLEGCAIVETHEQAQLLMRKGISQGSIKKLCGIIMEVGGSFETLVEAADVYVDGMKWKDIQEALANPSDNGQQMGQGEDLPTNGKDNKDNPSEERPENGPPACQGKNKDDPGC